MLLHELGHVHADERVFRIEEKLGKRLGELGLTHTGGTEKEERPVGSLRIGKPGARTANGIGHRGQRLALAHDALAERFFHAEQFVPLALQHLADGDAGPLRDDFGDFLLRHFIPEQARLALVHAGGSNELLLQRGNFPVLQFRHPRQVLATSGRIEILARPLQLLLDGRLALYGSLLGLPDFIQVGVLALESLELGFEVLQALLRRVVRLLLEGHLLDLELDDAPVEPVHLLGLRVNLHAQARGGLVDEVDGLVRQLPVGDIAMRQRRCRHDGRVGDVHAVMNLVALLQPAEDGDGVLHQRLQDHHLLEAAFQRRILLDVLAVLVEGRGAHAMQFAAGERRLQHVARVHGAFGFAGPDDGVQLVDKENDLAFLLGQIVQHTLQAFLEVTAEFRAGDERAHVEREDALVFQAFRHFAVDDALGEAFDDRRLADAGLANEHRIVLGAPLEHLDRAANFVVAPDHGVELARLRPRGEVDGVLFQRLARLFRIGVVHGVAAADLGDGLVERALDDASFLENLAEWPPVIAGSQHEELAGDELVFTLLGQLVGDIEQAREVVGAVHVAARTLHLRHPVERLGQLRAEQVEVGTGLVQEGTNAPPLLLEQRRHQVHRLDELVVTTDRQRLRVLQGRLKSGGQFVHPHKGASVFTTTA